MARFPRPSVPGLSTCVHAFLPPCPWPPDDHGMSLIGRCLDHVSAVCAMSLLGCCMPQLVGLSLFVQCLIPPIEPFDTGASSRVASEALETPGAFRVGHSETTKMTFEMRKMLWRRGGKIKADSEGQSGSGMALLLFVSKKWSATSSEVCNEAAKDFANDLLIIPRSRLERLTSSLLVKRSTTELAGIDMSHRIVRKPFQARGLSNLVRPCHCSFKL